MFTGKLGSPITDAMKAGCVAPAIIIMLIALPSGLHLLAIVGAVIAYVLLTTREDVIVDIKGGRYKRIVAPLPFTFGKWKPIGTPEYLLLSDVHRSEGAWSLMGSNNSTFRYSGIYLARKEFDHMVLIHQESSNALAAKVAKELGDKWGIEVREETD